ncbi:MAG TPA: hypothetical protein VFO52_06875 [Longimicrobiales bacterium]|nr:hypothetical protein [Longimicrobiales bacterium]
MRADQVLRLAIFCCWWLCATPVLVDAQVPVQTPAAQQERLARRGAGVRVGFWQVEIPADDESRSPQFEAYLQRGLDGQLTLENSVGVWWVTTTAAQALPDAPDVETRAYIVPLLTSLKVFPMSGPGDRFEPYVMAGVGIALGIEDEGENAIGGGGSTIVTGLAFRGAVGAEFRLTPAFGLSAAGKYQWTRFGEDLGITESFSGVGAEGGLTYRFPF